MKFPPYKYAEYPKLLKFSGKKLKVNSRGEEMDAKLRYAENPNVLAQATESEILQVKREQSHIEEKQALFKSNMELSAQLDEMKRKVAELSMAKTEDIAVKPAELKSPGAPAAKLEGDVSLAKPVSVSRPAEPPPAAKASA